MPELVAPLPLAAAALVLVNDRVLKGAFPGLVTGKLSDVAGAFVLPLFLSALLALVTRWPLRARLAAGTAFTVIAIAAVKLSPVAAGATARALDAMWVPLGLSRAQIVVDPSDLVAAPLALAAYAYGCNACARKEVAS